MAPPPAGRMTEALAPLRRSEELNTSPRWLLWIQEPSTAKTGLGDANSRIDPSQEGASIPLRPE